MGSVGGGSEDLDGASVRAGPCTGVFRRPVMAAASLASGLLHFRQVVEVRGFWFQDVEDIAGAVVDWWMDRVRTSRSDIRQRRRT